MGQPQMRMTDDQAATVGAWIADARKRLHGWRQEDLAAASGMSKSNLSNIETGKQGDRGWNVSTLTSIEKALQIERGTLRRVAEGETIAPEDVRETVENGQVHDQLSRLVDEIRQSRQEQAGLRDQLEQIERRLAHVEQPPHDA